MIRINLLPVKETQIQSAGRQQVLLFAAVLLAVIAIMAVLYVNKASEVQTLKDQVAEVNVKVTQVKAETSSAGKLKTQMETLEKQLDVLRKLELARTGPVKVLDELQAMMSPPRNEEERFAQLQRNWNVEWNTERLWVNSMIEKNQTFEIKGAAINADDVAEFLQRLTTSKHFQSIQLDFVEAKLAKSKTGRAAREMKYVNFRITGDLSYSGEKVVRVDPKAAAQAPARRAPANN